MKPKRIRVYVIGTSKSNPAETDIVDIIERVPSGYLLTVAYKGQRYPVIGRKGSERIYVGIESKTR